jgi:hypothetical protein
LQPIWYWLQKCYHFFLVWLHDCYYFFVFNQKIARPNREMTAGGAYVAIIAAKKVGMSIADK